MKTLTIILSLFWFASYSQADTTKVDSVCLERGHVSVGVAMSTAMYCPPYLEETDSITTIVYPACNTITYTCARCGRVVKEREKERRIIIWKKD